MERTTGCVRPPVLRRGDTVAIVSPAGPADAERVRAGVALLRSWGLQPVVASHAHDRQGYLAGGDEARAADLNAAFADPQVRAVIATRGGYGSQRIVDRLDLTAVRRHPRPLVGFSDVTALHLTLWRAARQAGLYGPGAAWRAERTGAVAAESLRHALMSADPVLVKADLASETAPVVVAGTATGTLLGGNLCLLTASLATHDFPDLRGAILLIEDVDEPPYKVDRMLTQLRRAGVLAEVAAVAVGQFTACGGPGVAEVLRERLGDLGVPVLGGLPVGHGPEPVTVPLGVPAQVDATAGTLTVTAAVSGQ